MNSIHEDSSLLFIKIFIFRHTLAADAGAKPTFAAAPNEKVRNAENNKIFI